MPRSVEPCRQLADDVLATRPDIPWARIRASGNVLRHEYSRVADDVVWSVVVDELPALKAAVVAIRDGARHMDGRTDP